MRRALTAAGLAALLAIPALSAPTFASAATCHARKQNGTILGAVAGGLLGHTVAGHGVKTEGTLLGAGVGGLVGRHVGKDGCDNRRTAYYRRAPVRTAARPTAYRYASNTASCRYEQRPFYDERGRLVYGQTRICR